MHQAVNMEISIPDSAKLSVATVAFYRENGFVHVPGVMTAAEAADFRAAALKAASRLEHFSVSSGTSTVFDQVVNVWRQDEALRQLTLHPNVAAMAEQLAGIPLRLWHDQLLIKQPGRSRPTEFHQDQPYWPHANSSRPISCWIALQDVPVERGCMTFIPGSHRRLDLPRQQLDNPRSLFDLCPDLQWQPRVTVPLRAGDCTFHHGRCAHMATPNNTGEARVAHVVIFIDAVSEYSGAGHPVSDGLGLRAGQRLDHEMFPLARQFAELWSK